MKVITIGKRLIPVQQIALVEPFDPARNLDFQPDKEFRGRVVLLNRDTVLTEMPPPDFAATHGLCFLAEDNVAVSDTLAFRVEIFTPSESFKPGKAYRTRLKWIDQDGNEQSRLLMTHPETVILDLSRRQSGSTASGKSSPRRPTRMRRRSRKVEAARD